jgi:GT2 family glycosyltransferase
MVAFLDARPEVGMVYADYDLIDADGNSTGPGWVSDPDEIGDRNVVGCCFLYRRCVLDTIGGYAEDLFLAEDYDYWLRVMSRFPVSRLRMCLYDYRLHPTALTSTRTAAIREATATAVRRNVTALEKTAPRNAALAHLFLARWAHEVGDQRDTRTHLAAALRLAPWTTLSRGQFLIAERLLGARMAASLRRMTRISTMLCAILGFLAGMGSG